MKTIRIITALVLLCVYNVQAQVDLTNTGTMYITNSAVALYVNGGFTNASGASFTNNGDFYVTQNISNAQVGMSAGTGTLRLIGTTAQQINGTQTFKTYNLVTNNAAGFTLNNDLSVSGTHTFTDGLIASSVTPNYLVYEAGSSYSGVSDAAHVSGWVKKIGTTAFTFPVGDNTYYRNIAISSLASSSEFNARYNKPTPNATNVAAPLVIVNPNEYWDLNQVSGGAAVVTLNWDDPKVNIADYLLSEMRVANYSAGLWTSRGGTASGTITTQGTISSNSTSSFGQFSIASINWATPLYFIDFSAKAQSSYNLLQWKMGGVSSDASFEIERSLDGRNFTKIGTLKGLPLLSGYFQYQDSRAFTGNTWYRIKCVNTDGHELYSTIELIQGGNKSDDFYLVNNPAHQFVYIAATGKYEGTYDYQLLSVNGQLIQKGKITTQAGGICSISLSSSVVPGSYVLDIRNAQHKLTQQILVR